MKTQSWVIIFAALIVICAAVYFIAPHSGTESHVAEIYQDNVLLYSIDLNKVQEEYEIVLEREKNTNTVLVQRGRISILSADCHDQTCVEHGPLTANGTPIICLPNRVVIKWQSGGSGDVNDGSGNDVSVNGGDGSSEDQKGAVAPDAVVG